MELARLLEVPSGSNDVHETALSKLMSDNLKTSEAQIAWANEVARRFREGPVAPAIVVFNLWRSWLKLHGGEDLLADGGGWFRLSDDATRVEVAAGAAFAIHGREDGWACDYEGAGLAAAGEKAAAAFAPFVVAFIEDCQKDATGLVSVGESLANMLAPGLPAPEGLRLADWEELRLRWQLACKIAERDGYSRYPTAHDRWKTVSWLRTVFDAVTREQRFGHDFKLPQYPVALDAVSTLARDIFTATAHPAPIQRELARWRERLDLTGYLDPDALEAWNQAREGAE